MMHDVRGPGVCPGREQGARRSRDGFTLVELAVAAAVISILAATDGLGGRLARPHA